MTTQNGTAVVERIVGEYGNPITGTLDNAIGTLGAEIPAGSTCSLIGIREDTGAAVIPAGTVALTFTTVGAVTTISYVYTPAPPDFDTACTMRLRFKVVRSDNTKVVYVPDAKRYALYLQVNPV